MDSIGVLAGGIAHDFNNILTAIIGHSEIIRRTALDGKALRSLNVIEEASRRAGRMISKLLGFARKSNFEIVPLNVNDVIFDTVKLLERVIDKRIQLTVELDNRLPSVRGDVTQLEQVIMNLIVNARDAMPQGGRIVIRTALRDVHAGYAGRAALRSAGRICGHDRQRYGHRHSQGASRQDLRTVLHDEGTGKGHRAGPVHGLRRGEGTQGVHLGSERAEPRHDLHGLSARRPGAGQTVGGRRRQLPSVSGTETVLVVDDEQDILHAVQEALTSHGYKVFAVDDSCAGLSIFKKLSGEIELVITDIVMPGLNGKDLIAQVKEMNPDVKVLASPGIRSMSRPRTRSARSTASCRNRSSPITCCPWSVASSMPGRTT